MKKMNNKVTHINAQNFTNKILITHTDLDGVGCAIIFLKCFPKGEVIFADYHNIDETIVELLQHDADWDILITDITPSPRVASLLDSRGKVGLLDHHATAKAVYDKYPWATIDNSKCGTRMIYDMFCQYFNIEDHEEFVATVEDWDLWGRATQNESPSDKGIALQFLYTFYGRQRFISRVLSNGSDTLDENDEVVTILMEKFNEYYDETFEMIEIHEKDGYRFGICVADQYQSLLGNRLVNELDLEYVMILDPRRGKGSLRGKGNIDLGQLAKQAGGGGHAKAAGFPLGESAANLVLHQTE